MNKNYLYYLALFLMIPTIQLYSQVKCSELNLTGRGDLKLIGSHNKLQPAVYTAFLEMKKAALKEGVSIEIVSAYRSFEEQKVIWNRKYNKYVSKGMSPLQAIEKIVEYSTIPGTSRHHWGTEIDIIDGSKTTLGNYLVEKNFSKGGAYEKLKKWMDVNAEKFGFYIVYTNNVNRKGFKYEPWHYSYKLLSFSCLKEFLNIDLLYLKHIVDINGNEYLSNEYLNKYLNEQILDINPALKKENVLKY